MKGSLLTAWRHARGSVAALFRSRAAFRLKLVRNQLANSLKPRKPTIFDCPQSYARI